MFVSINTTSEDLKYLSNGDPIQISKDIALNREYLDFLFSLTVKYFFYLLYFLQKSY